jgi:hypothetical protein
MPCRPGGHLAGHLEFSRAVDPPLRQDTMSETDGKMADPMPKDGVKKQELRRAHDDRAPGTPSPTIPWV